MFSNVLRRASMLVAMATGLASAPAGGEITKLLLQCREGKLCPAFRASIAAPQGWSFDRAAERRLNVQVLVPKGRTFEDAGAVIYATVTYNPKHRSVADYIADDQAKWRAKAADVKIAPLPDVPRAGGKEAFRLYHYEMPSSTVQPFERVASALDSDKDGNGFLVGIVLSAKSMAALSEAEPAYLAVLKAY
jgi:hypothetical protein